MQDDLNAAFRRWLSADRPAADRPDDVSAGTPAGDAASVGQGEWAEDLDEDADTAFASLYESCVSQPLPSAQFTSETMAAIAEATAADARRAKAVRRALLWSGVPAGLAVIYFGAGPLFSVMSSALVASLNLLVAVVVWFANGADVRSSLWSVMTGIGRAAAAFVADPRVTIAIVVFQVVAVAALAALHRLLGPEREWLK